jgi:molybdopterin biosynthesis enzyme
MRYLTCPPNQAIGQIARSNISNDAGQRIIAKGHRLTAYDAERCAREGIVLVDIVITESDEVDENAAAKHIADSCVGTGVRIASAHHGRADIHADCDGVLRIDIPALQDFNVLPTQTLATIPDGSVVHAGQRVASIKILPFAVPRADLPQFQVAVVRVLPFVRTAVGVLVVGAAATHQRIQQTHLPPLLERLERYGAGITATIRCVPEQDIIVDGLTLLSKKCNIVISISETSVMGIDESIPRSLVAAGGSVIRHGAPVEPGNMMLLGSIDGVPFLAAPGCIRNRARNVVDLLLPRLIADDVPTARDIAGWAHGGLLRGNDD